jgi:hypothetical protein
LDEIEIALKVVTLEAGGVASKVVGVEVVETGDGPGEEASTQRGLGHESDSQLTNGVENPVILHVARPQGPLRLESGDGVNGVGATNGVRSRFTDAEVADLPRVDEFLEGTPGLLHGYPRVHSVLVVEVDVVHAETLEGGVAGPTDVVGVAINSQARSVLTSFVTELGGEHDLIATRGDGSTHETLVREGSVHVGGVEEGHTRIESGVDDSDRLIVVRLSVELGHAHAPESLGGDFNGVGSGAESARRNAHGDLLIELA